MERGFKFRWHKALMSSDLTVVRKAVGACLFDYASSDGGNVRPGRNLLVEQLGISSSTVDRSLKVLREEEWIVRVTKGSSLGRKNMADLYRLTFPDQSSPVTSGEGEPVVTGAEWCPTNQSSFRANQSSRDADQSSPVRQPVVTRADPTDHEQINTTDHVHHVASLESGAEIDDVSIMVDQVFTAQPSATVQKRSDDKNSVVDAEVVPEPLVLHLDHVHDALARLRDAHGPLDADEEEIAQRMRGEGKTFFQMVKVIRGNRDAKRPGRRRAG